MRHGLLHRDRRDQHDAPRRTFAQVGQGEPHEPDGRQQQQLVGRLELIVLQRRGCDRRRAAGVPDDDVDAAERLQRPLDETFKVGRVRDVAADSEGADPLRVQLQLLAAAREHRDVRTFGRQCLRRRKPEPG